MYVWSELHTAKGTFRAGTEVNKSDLGVSDDEWSRLIHVRALRKEKYPKINLGVSPNQYKRTLAAKLLDEATVGNRDDDHYVFAGATEVSLNN